METKKTGGESAATEERRARCRIDQRRGVSGYDSHDSCLKG